MWISTGFSTEMDKEDVLPAIHGGGRRILAPLRGVTIRPFRRVFADAIVQSGFVEAITPFIAANQGFDPLKDRELGSAEAIPVTPQFIGKDPAALRASLERIAAAGYTTADLNCGCPYPMVRNKGRGSGLLRTPEILRQMLEAGCQTMGPGRFSVKVRLGIDREDELLGLMRLFNGFPLRFITVHARTAAEMYDGPCHRGMFAQIISQAKCPVVLNGDIPLTGEVEGIPPGADVMIGRAFIRSLGDREDIGELLDRYIELSRQELCGERPVLCRLKELLAYWKDLPRWRRRWQIAKRACSLRELRVW